MVENATQRRLTAILSADVKGYSKLMGEDDESTVATITAYRKIITKLIQDHQGRVVDTPGDNILAEFGSTLNAVNSAIDIQRTLEIENGRLPEIRRMVFRIGINLGDILHKDDCIYGDGVNVAARIESLADPGGICISRGVFDQVKRKVRQGFEYLGEHEVKNTPEPVRIYRILLTLEDEGKVIGEPTGKPTKLQKTYAVIAALISICGVLVLWMFYQQTPEIEPASEKKMEYPLPEKPSIAVLPFDNLSVDPEQEYFCDGLTEEIITALSKVPKVFVIARNSVFTYKGKPVKVKQVAEELGIRYVLEGSVRKGRDKLRITAQLIDALSGHHLWAERYDRDLKDIFAVQDELTKKIITAMQVELTSGEQARVDAKGTENLQAYLKFLQAREHTSKHNIEGNALGRQLAQEAIELDPEYPMPYRILAATHRMDVFLGTSKSPKESKSTCMKLLKKAIALDDTYAEAYGALGFTLSMLGQHDKAVATAKKAVVLDPNSATSYAMLGHTLRMADRPKEAIQAYTKAIRLNPIPPTFYQFGLGMSYSLDGQYEKGIQWCKKSVRQNPDDLIARLMLSAVYSMAGEDEKARTEAIEVLRINPKYSLVKAEKRATYKYKDKMIAALRKAGLPDNPPLQQPEKASIAVLPFDNMSDDPAQDYFSDGISEDLITDLSKISDLLVISRLSSFTYKGKNIKVQQIAEELRVRYVLEGSVRKAENRLRINAQLIDASTGHHLWADRYDGDMTDVFALQDRITSKIISALALKLTDSEQKAVTDKGTDNLQAYDEYLKGWQGYRLLTKAGFAEAKIRLEKAIELDPEFARAYAALAVLYWRATHYAAPEHRQGLGLTTRQELLAVKAKPQFLVRKAMKNPTALAHGLMSQFYLMRYQHDEAFDEIERALAMDPNNPELYAWMSEIFWLMGKNSEAIESANMGLRLDPNNPATYLRQLGRSYLPDGDLEESLQLLERAKRLNPELSGTVAFHQSVIYGIQGHIEEARTTYEIWLNSRMYPVRNLNDILIYFPFTDPKKLDRIADALVKAGAPGKPTDYYRILKENRINGQEVKSLLFDRKIIGIAMSTGKPIGWEWTDNGEFKFTMGKFQTMGNSWIDGDVFFIQFKKMFGGLPYGTVIYRNPDGSSESMNKYLMISDIGTITRFALAD